MPVARYRIINPTIALFQEDGRHVAHTVPTGTIITIPNGKPFDGDKLVEVQWDGRTVMMFAQDLSARSILAD